jgi:phosphate-selective porin OprO and OprP
MRVRRSNVCAAVLVSVIIGAQALTPGSRAEDTNTVEVIKQLLKRIDELERKVKVLEESKATNPVAGEAKGNQRIEELDQKVKTLEHEQELAQESTAARQKRMPIITLGEDGFAFGSASGDFLLRLRGTLQLDSRTYLDDAPVANNDGFLLRRARVILQGTVYKDFDYVFLTEFAGNGAPQILNASVNYRYTPALQFQAGKFVTPFGLEMLQPDRDTFFNERALASDLVPNRDVGLQVHGDLFEQGVNYAAALLNGTTDGTSSPNNNFADDLAFAGRLFFQPFVKSSMSGLRGAGFGLSGTYETVGSPSTAALPSTTGGILPGYYTDGQLQFFAYNPGDRTLVVANGDHWRLSPQAYYFYGPFGLMGEYVISNQRVSRVGSAPIESASLQNAAWEITGSWVVTGEDATYGGGVVPLRPFNPLERRWGALQVVARVMKLEVDPAAFPRFSDPLTSAQAATAWSLGLNWYLNHAIRVNASFSHTFFNGGGGAGITAPATVTRKDENVLFTRVQLAF